MAIKFEKVRAGMELLDIHRHKMGNTTMSELGCWPVRVLELVPNGAIVSWNHNRPQFWGRRQIERLYTKEPKSYRVQEERKRDRRVAARRRDEGGEAMSERRPAIQVWRFEDAPDELQALSKHGGDEDWVALVPAEYADEWIGWAEGGGAFGCCSVDEEVREDGSRVFIGAHA